MREREEKIASNKVALARLNVMNDELQNSFGNLYLAFNRFVHIGVYTRALCIVIQVRLSATTPHTHPIASSRQPYRNL